MDKEDLELITRLEREEIQDVVKEELEKERDRQEKARTLTEQEEAQLARRANHALAVTNCKKAIASFNGFITLVCAFVALILLLTAGWWWYISKQSDNFYNNFYKAKYDKAISEYIEQAKADAAWSMTDIGKEAHGMDIAGVLQDLVHCKLKGFVREKGKDGRYYCSAEKHGAKFLVLPN